MIEGALIFEKYLSLFSQPRKTFLVQMNIMESSNNLYSPAKTEKLIWIVQHVERENVCLIYPRLKV